MLIDIINLKKKEIYGKRKCKLLLRQIAQSNLVLYSVLHEMGDNCFIGS